MRIIPGIPAHTHTHTEHHNRACVVALSLFGFILGSSRSPRCFLVRYGTKVTWGRVADSRQAKRGSPQHKRTAGRQTKSNTAESGVSPHQREANMGGNVNRGAARSAGEVGDLMCPGLADRCNLRLEAARRHSVIRLIDRKPDQCETVPTPALLTVFQRALMCLR